MRQRENSLTQDKIPVQDDDFKYLDELPKFPRKRNKSIQDRKRKVNIKKSDETNNENNADLGKNKKEIINKKYAQTGATPPQKYEHMEATIEYIQEGGYYLIMYEKEFIRAWGAIKR